MVLQGKRDELATRLAAAESRASADSVGAQQFGARLEQADTDHRALQGKAQAQVNALHAGDLGAIAKLKDAQTVVWRVPVPANGETKLTATVTTGG